MTRKGEPPAAAGQKALRTRQRIIAVAAHELATHGYAGTTLRSVAGGAGLHLGSLYFHFASKDDLVVAAVREGIEFAYGEIALALRSLPEDADAGLRLRAAIRGHLEALHTSRDRGAAVVRVAATLPPQLRESITRDERRYGALWTDVLTKVEEAGMLNAVGDLRVVRDLLLGALNSTLETTHKRRSLDTIAATAASLVLGAGGSVHGADGGSATGPVDSFSNME